MFIVINLHLLFSIILHLILFAKVLTLWEDFINEYRTPTLALITALCGAEMLTSSFIKKFDLETNWCTIVEANILGE